MRTRPAALLVLAFLLPLGLAATPAEASVAQEPEMAFTASFEFDETAARPPADLEGFLVLESHREAVTVNGSVVPTDHFVRPHSERPMVTFQAQEAGAEPILHVDEEMAPHATVRIPLTVPVERIGTFGLTFHPGGTEHHWADIRPATLTGLSPVSVTLDAPDPDATLVSAPGSPAQVTVTLTARPGSSLTDLRLEGNGAAAVEVGDLAPGRSFTATLELTSHEGQGRFSVHRLNLQAQLSGTQDGEPFSHVLHRDAGAGFEPVDPVVYVAGGSSLFALPPQDARLGEPTALEIVALNTGTQPVHARGRVELRIDGLPHLTTSIPVAAHIEPGAVETVRVDWTPPAAGPWSVMVHHQLTRGGLEMDAVHVAGPVASADLRLDQRAVPRGTPTTASVVLTASEDVTLEGLRLSSRHAPLRGTISIEDLVAAGPVPSRSLEAGEPTTLEMRLTPKATGSHNLFLVVDTPDGPSVHHVGTITVTGSPAEWPLAWSPTLVVGLGLGVHLAWRRAWIT